MRRIFIYIEGELEDGASTVTIQKNTGGFPKKFIADEIKEVTKEDWDAISKGSKASKKAPSTNGVDDNQSPAKPGK